MDAQQIRAAYLAMMAERGHTIIDRASLVPHDDPTTLFTGSGMQPLLRFLLGETHPAGNRLADVQPCVRAQDIEEVGDNRHTTFFEMLGNWSLGDYFKAEQIPMFWSFLVDVVGLDPNRIYVSVFSGDAEHGIPRDEESADIWTDLFQKAGVSADRVDLITEEHGNDVGNQGARIAFYQDKNWWSRAGGPNEMPVGDPGGPDSEVFYYFPQVVHDTAYGRFPHQNSDGGQYLEIGNSVFMQYRRAAGDDGAGFAELPHRNVDYGGGLERIAAAAIDSPDVFRVSLLWPIIEKLQGLSGKSYDDETHAMRIVTDHVRGAVFLAADGVSPSNREAGYVMRRLLRRAIRFATELGVENNVLAPLVDVVADIYADSYPEVGEKRETIVKVLQKEERAFRRTLNKGLRELRHIAKENRPITGDDFFTLSDTFGFPVELSTEEAQRQGLVLSTDWRAEFDDRREEQRRRSQAATKLGAHE
ncbi:alanine--tRNA ligase-related protein [Gordonia sp. ABSL11-1]|uniref:alanine--tRNA ligase-related protein n=1 Tax=Gordonia sp. ABSL11-1 TaxID=3053924 RepID=UPI002573B031|nr:alanine--tRNA ligase-related protein [Gordonia sp. ABSL11-1]MDL9944952.1 alanine--tRNA ligase-related protein [Gordonia sp. ABSL11-1]